MKLCLKWINDYCKVTARPEEIARLLTMAGLELKSMETVLGDVRMELDVTANRTDCLSIIGIAREVAALTGGEARLPELPCPARSTGSAPGYGVEVLDQKLCPRYTARLVRGVKIQPSPLWMQERIEAVGIRSINNIVDITNFILMEVGQPLHAFDLLKLNGPRIIVRRAEPGEKITAIDGREYELNSDNQRGLRHHPGRPHRKRDVRSGVHTARLEAPRAVVGIVLPFRARRELRRRRVGLAEGRRTYGGTRGGRSR
jgi:phenylalanyl-tRNA synthetase beta chain